MYIISIYLYFQVQLYPSVGKIHLIKLNMLKQINIKFQKENYHIDLGGHHKLGFLGTPLQTSLL